MRKLKIKLQIAHFFKKISWSGLILVLRILTSVLINIYIGLTKICLNFGILRGFFFSKIYDFLVWVKNKKGTVPVTEYYQPTGYLQYNLEVEPEVIGKKRHFYYFITDWFLSTGARIIGTVMSLFIRINLTIPGDALFLGNIQLYNVIITGHAVIMIFFLVIPALIGGFGNWFVPLIIGPFLFFGAFGIFETLMAVLQSFVPAQIWVKKLYLFAQKVWAGFFLLTTLCCKKIVMQPRNVLQKSTILTIITEYAAELIMFILGFIILYSVIKIIDQLIKEKPNLKFWYTLVITALNWVIVILLISYIIVNLLFIIFPMQGNKTILTIGSILSLCTLWLVISNLFFLINKYKDRFSDQNRFFMAIFYMCQLIIKVLYKTKLIDKMFYLVCFQFFNTNQKTADLCNVISIILCLIYIFLLRTVIRLLRIAFSYEVYDFYSPNQLFVIWILFLAGFTGFLFRLCVNFSYKVVTFTFLYFPIYYNIIIARTNTINKPKINFYYQRIPVQNWFFVNLLGIHLGVVLFHSVILHVVYTVYLGELELKQTKQQYREYVESLNCNKILTILNNFTGSEEELKDLQVLKAFCEVKLHPEDAEIIFKDYPKTLESFRRVYPKNTTMQEQPLIPDTEKFDILAWAQANVNFIVIGIIILLVVVYFVKQNKPK